MVVRRRTSSTLCEVSHQLAFSAPIPSKSRSQSRKISGSGALVCLLLVTVCAPSLIASAAGPALIDPRTVIFDTVESVSPEPDRIVLKNGMVIYLLEDHELPLITMSALIRTGSWLDPSEKVGLAALTGAVMRT